MKKLLLLLMAVVLASIPAAYADEIRKPTETKVSKEPVKPEFDIEKNNNYQVSYRLIKGQTMRPVKKLVTASEAQKLWDLYSSKKTDGDGNTISELNISLAER